jgi:hypothetical protein
MQQTTQPDYRFPARSILLSIGLIVLSAIVFNRVPQRVGVYDISARGFHFTPLLAPGFRLYLPWLNLLWAVALLLECARLFRRRWTPGIRQMDLALRMCGAVLSFGMALDAARIFVPAAADDLQTLLALLGIALLSEPVLLAIFDGGEIVPAGDQPVQAPR